jgi:hypothetical protein
MPADVDEQDLPALARALCGDDAAAQSVLDREEKARSRRTGVAKVAIPISRALIAMHKGDTAGALEALQPSRDVELGQVADFWPTYIEGVVALAGHRAAEAAVAFEKITTHRSVAPASPLYPLAYLGLGRAEAQAGDARRSQAAYDTLFEIWKDADPKLPAVAAASREYQELFHHARP